MAITTGLADTARVYRDRYGDEMSTRRLAKIMWEENPLLFDDLEHARTSLRYIEGKYGKEHLGKVAGTSYFKAKHRTTNPFGLPKTDEREYWPFEIKGKHRILLLSDLHIPYHNISAVTAAIKFGKKRKPDIVLLNGDIIDCHQLSRFEKDPRKRHFNEELTMMGEMIQVLKKELNAKIIYKIGNHEERYDYFLRRKSKELIGLEEFELHNIIKKRAGEDVEIVGDKRIIYANDLNILHGHEYGHGIFNPVNPARGLMLRAKASAVQGHNHQVSEHTAKSIRDEIRTTWSTGCLCELNPEYLPLNEWAHGFAEIDLEANGTGFKLKNYRVRNGKIL